MSSSKFKVALAGLALLSAVIWPNSAQSRGGFAIAPAAAPAMGGGMGMGSAAFGGGASFGGFPTPMVTPSTSSFNNFPFFGGGAFGYGSPNVITQPYVLPTPVPVIPPQSLGPVQVEQTVPFANPVVKSTREVFVNGTPSVVTSPMVVEYHWPSGKVASKTHRTFMRTRARTH